LKCNDKRRRKNGGFPSRQSLRQRQTS
jgi:predicted Rdx family selenoprotein